MDRASRLTRSDSVRAVNECHRNDGHVAGGLNGLACGSSEEMLHISAVLSDGQAMHTVGGKRSKPYHRHRDSSGEGRHGGGRCTE